MYYQVNPYKVARLQNALMRKVASDPGLDYALRKKAGALDGLVKLLGKGLKSAKGLGQAGLKYGKQGLDAGLKYGKQGLKATEAAVREHPFEMAGTAGGVGLGLGYDIGHAVGDDGISSADVINSAGLSNSIGYSQGVADTKARIKSTLYEYLPYVGGGAALASIVGGVIGNAAGNTLAGSLIGAGTGAAAGAVGKGLYDKYIG